MSLKSTAGSLLSLLSLLVTAGAQGAGADDLTQPLRTDADRQEFNFNTKQVILTGNVKITQGSILILADRLEMIRTADGSAILRLLAHGQPAHFQQVMEDGTPMKAEGNLVDYRRSEQLLLIEGNGELSQASNLIRGHRIHYDLAKEQLQAESNPNNYQERVTTIFLAPLTTTTQTASPETDILKK